MIGQCNWGMQITNHILFIHSNIEMTEINISIYDTAPNLGHRATEVATVLILMYIFTNGRFYYDEGM